MKIFISPEQVTTRNGTKVSIRSFEPQDGPSLQAFFRGLSESDRMYLRDDVTRDSWIDAYIWKLDQNLSVPVIAVAGDRIEGNATLYRRAYGWSAHVGEIRVAVSQAYQGQGLAKKLVRPLVRAGVTLGLDQLVAHLVDNQVSARRLLESLGFQQDAVLTGRVKDSRGVRRDLVVMCNEISHVWDAMEALVSDYSPMRE
jgi:RimJ/RimL family protein N-acetyltransferase